MSYQQGYFTPRDGSNAMRAYKELIKDPDQKNVDIAKKLGISAPYVSTIRQRYGFLKYGTVFPRARTVSGLVDYDNLLFMISEAEKNNIEPSKMINLIITDARLDAEERKE